MASADVILHPVRLRIVQALQGDRILTAAQLLAELRDVPPATLYRHLAVLVREQVLRVADEHRVRGAVERRYELVVPGAEISADEVARMTPDQHRAGFRAFVAGVLAEFDAYLDRPGIDPMRDVVSYRQATMWLTGDEALAMVADLRRALAPWLAQRPAPGRRRRALANVLVPLGPEPDGAAPEATPADAPPRGDGSAAAR